jgi:hypothetical protein
MTRLVTLAALADMLGNCRRSGRCDCLVCAADLAIERQFGPLFRQAVQEGS